MDVVAEPDKLHIKGKQEAKLFAHKWKAANDTNRNRVETKTSLNMDYDFTDNLSLTVSPELYYDSNHLGRGVFANLSETNEMRYFGNVEEAYLLYSGEQYDISIGKRIFSWGKADGYKPLDNLNSFDVIDVPDYRKIGIPSAAFNYSWPETSVNFVLVPFFTPSRHPKDNNRWSGTGSSDFQGGQFNMNYINYAFATGDTILGQLLSQYGIATEGALDTFLDGYGFSLSELKANPNALQQLAIIDDRDLPARKIRNMQYGFQLNTTKKGWDYTVSYYDGYNNMAVMKRQIRDGKIHYIPTYNKMKEVGGAFSTTFDKVEVHGEGAWHFTEGQADDDYLEYIFGGSYTWDSSQITWFDETKLFLEYAGQKVTNYKSNKDYIGYAGYSRPFRNSVLGRLMVNINTDNQFDLSGCYSFNDADQFFQPKYTHKFNDNWKLVTGLDWFTGEDDDFFGKWDRNDRFFSFVTYSF